MERLKKNFLLFMERDPDTAKAFLYHIRVKAHIDSIDELFRDESTFKKALLSIFDHTEAELFIKALNRYSAEIDVIKK